MKTGDQVQAMEKARQSIDISEKLIADVLQDFDAREGSPLLAFNLKIASPAPHDKIKQSLRLRRCGTMANVLIVVAGSSIPHMAFPIAEKVVL